MVQSRAVSLGSWHTWGFFVLLRQSGAAALVLAARRSLAVLSSPRLAALLRVKAGRAGAALLLELTPRAAIHGLLTPLLLLLLCRVPWAPCH